MKSLYEIFFSQRKIKDLAYKLLTKSQRRMEELTKGLEQPLEL